MRLSRGLALASGAALMAGTAFAGVAEAKPVDKGTFHEESTEIVEDLCGVPGLTARVDTVHDGRFLENPRGSDGLVHQTSQEEITDVITILATGEQFIVQERAIINDLKITDNGDGTTTLLVLVTGNVVLFGPDGKAIARNPGQERFEVLFGADDEFLDFSLVKGPTGRTDDFCEGADAPLD